ncbi:MAG: hypothetical protein ACSHX8_09165 [Opitutaceae bacterium]
MKSKGIIAATTIIFYLCTTSIEARSYGFLQEAISDYQESPSEENNKALEAARTKAELFDAGIVILFAAPFGYIAFRLILKRR